MKIPEESRDAWAEVRRNVNNKLREAEEFREAYLAAAGDDADANVLEDIDARIYSLRKSGGHMDELESSEQVYELNYDPWLSEGGLTYDPSTDVITLNYSDYALFVHELEHVWQFEQQKFGYDKDNTFSRALDIYDEAAAYRAQWAFDPDTVNGLNPKRDVSSMDDINHRWVKGIEFNGKHPYGRKGEYTVGQRDITVFSTGKEVRRAYNWVDRKTFSGWKNTPLKDKYNLHYKK